jgi:hypothetical protein
MAKHKTTKPKKNVRVTPVAWQTKYIDDLVNDELHDVNIAILEPREWLDHCIVDVVQDMKDCSWHVNYSRSLLVYWYAHYFACSKCKSHTWACVENEYNNDVDKYHDLASEWVDANTMRGAPYMGENRPMFSL